MFSNGSASSISFATETPSFVITGEPYFLSIITIRPQGPSVVLTALEICSTPESSFLRASSLNNNCLAIFVISLNICDHPAEARRTALFLFFAIKDIKNLLYRQVFL